MYFRVLLEYCDEGKDCVEHGAWVGHQQLLLVHVEGRDKQFGGRHGTPSDNVALFNDVIENCDFRDICGSDLHAFWKHL